jgi:hypothetical protein
MSQATADAQDYRRRQTRGPAHIQAPQRQKLRSTVAAVNHPQ